MTLCPVKSEMIELGLNPIYIGLFFFSLMVKAEIELNEGSSLWTSSL